MRLRPSILAALVLLGIAGAPVLAQEEVRVEEVRFAAGASGTVLKDRITGREFVVYRIGAEAGQQMDITLTSANTAAYFNVYEPGRQPGDEALVDSGMVGPMVPDINRFSAKLPSSGVYSVSVYLYRNAARAGETADYTLDISITGATGEVVEGDFADGLEGGPDFWRVKVDGGLNLRAEPSAGAAIVTRLANGTELRNLGCRMAEARTWCRVATLADPGFEGWAAGDYLVEGSGEGVATQLPDMAPVEEAPDALVEGTMFNATGMIECFMAPGAEPVSCEFGVQREGNGNGTVMVTLPDGTLRGIFYENGVPVTFNKSQADGDMAFEAKKQEDGYMVFIGQTSFVLPDAIIYGG